MPLLKIQSNCELPTERRDAFLRLASERVAAMLSKPERYVMVTLEYNPAMLFAGDSAPLAYLELKSIGLPGEGTKAYSTALCQLIGDQLSIPEDRIYIEFSDAPRHMWGWNSGTFER